MGNNCIVHLIRHEQTAANIKRKYIGWTDESILSKENYFDVPIRANVVYGSDLKRCKETAELYFPAATYSANSQLRELNFGDFEMKTYEELQDISQYRQWIEDPQNNTPPNGEAYQVFVKRVLSCFHQIISENKEYTFIVHGGVIRAILASFAPVEEEFRKIKASHRMIYTLKWCDFSYVREGKRCRLLLEEPIMAKENL
ncbi:histidine phosphatase family protein [Ureibacillus chungkukjangi]|uniref:Alpha-ribazole phosphatase n=1 Tax=Ureibacillus chungkukjangi TaxID=1202712 RepID=A0A318TDY3_9BACL|nr:histidine phosphatase family protein [Ureibacillus chungkukjangi]MCM3387938.1 histidine phosphatase family protein [Ureibacillus chungkukjangi]PYF03071.1 alpha-ribazole phosphatase [Ureibacillus chungkukjangi]